MMHEIEAFYPDARTFTLDTPAWNTRTNSFYRKLGYEVEFIRENEDPKLSKYFLKKAIE